MTTAIDKTDSLDRYLHENAQRPLTMDERHDLRALISSLHTVWEQIENLAANVGRPMACDLTSKKSMLNDPTTAMVEFLLRVLAEIRKP